VYLQYGVGDEVVGNEFSDRLAALMDLPVVGPTTRTPALPLRSLTSSAVPADGRGVSQTYALNSSDDLRGFVAHVAFGQPSADRVYRDWLANRLAASGLRR
jgi:hypothetical protein